MLRSMPLIDAAAAFRRHSGRNSAADIVDMQGVSTPGAGVSARSKPSSLGRTSVHAL